MPAEIDRSLGEAERAAPGSDISLKAAETLIAGASPISDSGGRPPENSYIRLSSGEGVTRSPPRALLDRYEDLRLLGEGGVGAVFRARDPRLGRLVALKLLRSDHPDDTQRVLQEARAQARVQHDNVCRVYEVGEADGQPYIAMEFIDGKPLARAQAAMSLEQKVKVTREVAAALHEAHRLGLIHRDIKPGNIMVTRTEDGAVKPFVVDFGLAGDASSEEQSTQSGGIVGTPSYMSPEQALSGSLALDRRSDVYSLGATLFDLIAGRPPHVGSTIPDLLTKVVTEEAPALSSVRRGVPADLETIVATCLQKDPSRRYESARALGDDLQRFLDGEPIQARRASLRHVLWSKAKKNKALVAVAAVGLSAAIALGGMLASEARRASEQARLGRELGEDVKYVELFLRVAYSLPAHDVDQEFRVVRVRLEDIQRRMAEAGRAGQGPGHYALGRGYWALHDYEAAQEHLDQALAVGYGPPEVHVALGLTLGERYKRALTSARRIEYPPAREAAIRTAEATYRDPALSHLRIGGGTQVESKAYTEGLVALYEKRYRDATDKAVAASTGAPWLYEAKSLEGDARFAAAVAASEGGRKDEARDELVKAIDAYKAAAAVATSDAAVHEALAEAWLQILSLEVWQGRPYRAAFDAALAACDDAIASNPRSSDAHTKRSKAYLLVGEYLLRTGDDPRPMMKKSIESAEKALALAPDDAVALDSIGNDHILIATYEAKLGIDPVPSLERGLAALDAAVKITPTFAWAWNDGGVALMRRAIYEAELGVDPRASVGLGVERYERATKEDPAYLAAYTNTTFILTVRAAYDLASGRDPRPDLRRALDVNAKAFKLDPRWLPALNNGGWAELVGAQYDEVSGGDPTAALARAEASFQSSLDITQEEADTHFGMGSVKYTRARFLIRSGAAPDKALDEARASLARAASLDTREPAIREVLARLLMTMARRARGDAARDAARRSLIDEATKALTEGLNVNPRNAPLHAAAAELYALRAEDAIGRKEEPDADIAEGLSHADKALAIHRTMALAVAAKGALYSLRARSGGASREADRRAAIESLERALALNPLLQESVKDTLAAARGL